jgi:hypothetical protein
MRVIGYNNVAQQRDERNAGKKAEYLQQIVDFFEHHHLPTDLKLIDKEGAYNYFQRLFAETYSSDFPAYMTAPERLQMAKVNTTELMRLQASYEAMRTPFDPLTMRVPENVDYNIYIDGAKEDLFDKLEQLETAIKEYSNEANKHINSVGINTYYIDFKNVNVMIENVKRQFV